MFFSQHDVSGLDRFCVVLLLVSCFHHGSAADVGTDPAAQNSSGPLQWPLEDGWNLFEGKDIENSEGRYYTPNNTWLPLPAIPNLNTSEGLVDTYILFTFQVPAVGPGQDAELSFDYLDDNDKELADPGELTKFYSDNTKDMLRKLIPWLRSSDFLVTTPYDRRDYLLPSDTPVYGFENSLCPRSRCSSREWCEPFYKAFFLFLAVKPSRDLESWPAFIADDFFSELTDNYGGQKAPNPFLSCPIVLTPDLGSFAGICASLGNDPYFKNATLWTDAEVTLNLEVFKKGGLDTQRVRWEGLQSSGDSNETLVSALYRNLLSVPNYDCDLRNPCRLPLDCEKVGSRSALGLSGTIYTELWPYLVLVAIQNFNQALTNQFNAIDSAAIRATLDTFTIDGFFPSPSPKVDLTNSLSNLGTIFSVLSLAPVPGVGSALSLGATFLPAVGTFYADKVATQVPADEPQRLFAPQVKAAYEFLLNAFYNVTYTLFHDGNINGVTLTDIIGTGDWLDSSSLQSLIDVQEQLKIEVLSHGLDGLWKSPPSNKMWVLYENLTGTGIDCASHNTGPSDSKYCADDGVYYAYNFLEKGDHKGVVGYPWGGEHLKDLGLEMSMISEASAKTYRLAKNVTTLDAFHLSGANLTTAFLDQTVNSRNSTQLFNQAGRYPGSWTFPVCDASTWGSKWNFDYMKNDYWNIKEYATYDDLTLRQAVTHPPCMCGPGGTETAAFVNSTGLLDFDTYYERCARALRSKDFKWPDGVESVNFGFGDPIKRP